MPPGQVAAQRGLAYQAGAPNALQPPPAAPADPMAAYQPYIDSFNKSLQSSQAAIAAQIAQAQQQMGQRRDAAAQVVAGLPAAAKQSYQGASQGLSSALAAGQGSLSPDVAGKVSALGGPLDAALQQNQAGESGMEPFLNLANMANYQTGSSNLSAAQANATAQGQTEQRTLQSALLQAQVAANSQQHQNDFTAQQNALNREASLGQQAAATDAQTNAQLAASGYHTTAAQVRAVQADPTGILARITKLEQTGVTTAGAKKGPALILSSPFGGGNPEDGTIHRNFGSEASVTQRPTGTQIAAMLTVAGKNQAYIDAVHSLHPEWWPQTLAAPAKKK